MPTRGGLTFGEPKTKRGWRTIALDQETVAALHEHRERQKVERALMGDAYADSDLVFAQDDGSPIHPEKLTREFEAHIAASGLPRIRLHDLRHTHATLALAAAFRFTWCRRCSATRPRRSP